MKKSLVIIGILLIVVCLFYNFVITLLVVIAALIINWASNDVRSEVITGTDKAKTNYLF